MIILQALRGHQKLRKKAFYTIIYVHAFHILDWQKHKEEGTRTNLIGQSRALNHNLVIISN